MSFTTDIKSELCHVPVADETALAEAEIEYHEDPVDSVFVKFPMHDDKGKLSHLDHPHTEV